MRVHLLFVVYLLVTVGSAQTESGRVIPNVVTMPIEEGAVTVLHLGPGYTSSVKLPEEITSVVIGNPASFKAEHSEAEPRLVFLKPTTMQPSESNALITTRSGQQVSLQLISSGKASTNARVDFLLEYRRAQSLVIDSDRQSFLVAETRPIAPVTTTEADLRPIHAEKADLIAQELDKQRSLSSLGWEGKDVLAAVGESIRFDQQTILGFSILNSTKRVVELLPPLLELSSSGHGNAGKRIKAEPVAVADYRMTTRRLEPGQRADGVIVFERPAFKESAEKLQLQLAAADQVDRPILLSVPFTSTTQGGVQ